jgi:branched-chain amino acid aminotransferase
VADEVFMTGTAAEIVPVTKIDNISIGTGKPGPVVQRIQKAFFDIVKGEVPDRFNWLMPIK